MEVPIPLIIRNGLLTLTRKFAEILVSSLATVLVMALFPFATKPIPPFARDEELGEGIVRSTHSGGLRNVLFGCHCVCPLLNEEARGELR